MRKITLLVALAFALAACESDGASNAEPTTGTDVEASSDIGVVAEPVCRLDFAESEFFGEHVAGHTRTTYHYDEDGLLLTAETETDIEHIQDARVSYTYDSNGNEVTAETDMDMDGSVDERRERTWDAEGRLATEAMYNAVALKSHTAYTYSDDGLLLTEDRDSDGDGELDLRLRVFRDGRGGTLKVEYVTPDTGDVWQTDTYANTYDDQGNLVRFEVDMATDGVVDSIVSYAYDEAGNQLSMVLDATADRIDDRREDWTYDGAGNMLTHVVSGVDGDVTTRRTYTYECE